MNPYYALVEHREICEKLLREFGLSPENAHIINGHVPVKIKQGESPIKGGGLLTRYLRVRNVQSISLSDRNCGIYLYL